MSPETAPELLTIFTLIAIILTLASAVGALLASSAGSFLFTKAGPDSSVIENLNARIRAWWVMIAVLAVAFAIGKGMLIALFALCSFNALREFLTLTRRNWADHWALAASFFVVLPIQYVSIWNSWYGFYAIFIPVYAFLALPILSVLRQTTDHFLTRISETQWALMIGVYCVSHVPALLFLEIPDYVGRNILLIVFLILVVQSSDVLQYVWGKLYGRHKIAPKVSPSKTWEGFIGGVLSASLIGAALYWITPFTPVQAFVMSLAITMMGFFGGLVMSAIKRDRGVKDWGHAIEGHGVAAAPIKTRSRKFFQYYQ